MGSGSPITVSQAGTYTATVTLDEPEGCQVTGALEIQGGPAIDVSIQSDGQSICAGGSITLTASSFIASTYEWSNGQSGPQIIITAPGNYAVVATPTDPAYCENSTSITITSNNETTINTWSDHAALCNDGQFGTTIYTDTGYNNYMWTHNGNPVGGDNASVMVFVSGNYSVTAENAEGCTVTGSVTIADGSGAISFDISVDPMAICSGDQVTLSIQNLTGIQGTSSISWSTGDSGMSITDYPDAPTTYTDTVCDSDIGCCVTNSIDVGVDAGGDVSISTSATTMCSGAQVTLTASFNPPMLNTQWYDGTADFGNNQTAVTITEPGTYTVYGWNSLDCIVSASITIAVQTPTAEICGNSMDDDCDGDVDENCDDCDNLRSKREAKGLMLAIFADKNPICAGEKVNLSLAGFDPNIVSTSWSPVSGNGTLVLDICDTPSQTTTYEVTVMTSEGCEETASIEIEVLELSICLSEVSFSGTVGSNYIEIRMDDNSDFYKAPQYVQSYPNGCDNQDTPTIEVQHPVAYVSGTKAKVEAKFEITCDELTTLDIKGEGPDGIVFGAQTCSIASGAITYNMNAANIAFTKDKVRYFENFKIDWSYSLDGGNSWTDFDKSDNKLYVTHDKPTLNSIFFVVPLPPNYFQIRESSIHFGCKYADMQTQHDAIVDKIFNGYFKNLDAKDINGDLLTYWGDGTLTCGNGLETFLTTNHGRCGIWSQYMSEMLQIQNITNHKQKQIVPKPQNMNSSSLMTYMNKFEQDFPNAIISSISSNYLFMVKNWPINQDYIDLDQNNFSHWQFTGGIMGAGAQNNDDPVAIFGDHVFLEYTNIMSQKVFYDPSYGIKINSGTLGSYEDAAIEIVKGVLFLLKDCPNCSIEYKIYVEQTNTAGTPELTLN